jgi:hypothetical protein
MRCPKCGFEQAEGTLECGKCGVIIAKVLKAQQMPSMPRPVMPPKHATAPAASTQSKTSDHTKPKSVVTIVSVLLVTMAIAWWINFPLANKIPAGAYLNAKHKFALSAPSDWLQLTPENSKRIFNEYKDRFTGPFRDALRDSSTKPGVEVGFIKMPDKADEFTPSFNIIVLPFQMPPLNEAEKDKAVTGMVGEMKKGLPGYTMESASIIKVDGLTSLEIIGSVPITYISQKAEQITKIGAYGRKQIVGYTPEVKKTITMRLRQLVVPGKKRAYLITYSDDANNAADAVAIFNSVTDSFRVMERPPRFGQTLRWTLNGAFIGLSTSLLYMLITGIFRRFSKNN